jgi:pentatricopeptide repeat domain-containing protein 1
MKLYLERLGCVFAPDGTCSNQPDIQDSLELVSRAVTDNEFLNYRPTITAAAVLYCERLHKGHLPFWPSSLSGLTSYSNARTPELSAAIGGAQRLWKQLVASRQPQQQQASAEEDGAAAAAAAAGEEPAAAAAADSTPTFPAPAASEAAAADGQGGADASADKAGVEEVTAQLSAAKV